MRAINMHEAKSSLSKLVEAIESGAEDEVVLARNGRPVARIVALAAKPQITLGIADGQYPALDLKAFDALDHEIADLFDAPHP